ncbi:MAG: hypothetical protein J3T61_10120 [Candidatus Brocadiales bacterium]|nr:hypothetical protein [Candidatus Bathyanammoxibius sp.]
MSDDYKVGYGKPPKHTRWQKGQSGNPKGRLKKQPLSQHQTLRRLREELFAATNKEVIVKDGEEIRRMRAMEAVFYKLVEKALGGDLRSIKFLMELMKYQVNEHEEWQFLFMEILQEREKDMEKKYIKQEHKEQKSKDKNSD